MNEQILRLIENPEDLAGRVAELNRNLQQRNLNLGLETGETETKPQGRRFKLVAYEL